MMQFSIVIPTYNERDNVALVVQRIRTSLHGFTDDYEIWFIDDSTDDTPSRLARLSEDDPHVHFKHRTSSSGLASAVVDGFQLSTGKYIVVMDADLQHPPEILPIVFQRLQDGIDIVIPSRFVAGGSDGGLNVFRKFVSWSARVLGQLMLRKLRQISDCTSGFFGLHRSVIQNVLLSPIGWKILIEVLVKGQYRTVHEVPYSFQSRDAGLSKMSFKEQRNYIRHIMILLLHSEDDRRFLLFCLVGLIGVFVNILALTILVYVLQFPKIESSILASLIAMIHNFIWNDKVTWRQRNQKALASTIRLPLFVGISFVGIAITTYVMDLLHFAHVNVLIGQGVGILVATYWNFVANNRWTWKHSDESGHQSVRSIVVTRETGKVQGESAS